MQEKQQAFLLDMLEYYTVDPINRRCTNDKNKCKYSPSNANKEGISEGCAIGRKIPVELQIELDRRMHTSVNNKSVFISLPSELQELSMSFLTDVQRLHDCLENWDKNGLTQDGKGKLIIMLSMYNIEVDAFEQYLSEPIPATN